MGGQRHTLATLSQGKTWYPLYRRLSGPQGWSGWVRKISPPPGFDPQTIQPIVSHYTNWAVQEISDYKLPRYWWGTVQYVGCSLCESCFGNIRHFRNRCVKTGFKTKCGLPGSLMRTTFNRGREDMTLLSLLPLNATEVTMCFNFISHIQGTLCICLLSGN